MNAVTHDTCGSADVLSLRDTDRPEITNDELLVHTHAAGVDRGVWHPMTGLPYPGGSPSGQAPKIPVPGMVLAGVVEAVGADVTRSSPETRCSTFDAGAHAEYARSEGEAHPDPANFNFAQARPTPSPGSPHCTPSGTTATSAGHKVLVIGASGGVGTCAAQLATTSRAHVTGVCSTPTRWTWSGTGR